MINAFTAIKEFQRRFALYKKREILFLSIGGAIASIMEMIALTAVIPLVLLILNPAIIKGRIMGALYAKTGLGAANDFAALLVAGIIGVFFIKLLISITLWRYEFKVLQKWRLRISESIFNSIINARHEEMLKKDSASLINILSAAIPYVVDHLFHNIINVMNTLLVFLFLVSIAIFFSAQAVVIASLFSTSLIYIFVVFKKKKTTILGNEQNHLMNENISILQMSIFGLKETKISMKQRFFAEKFQSNAWKLVQKDMALQFIRNIPTLIVEFIFVAAIMLAFIFSLLYDANISEAAIKIAMLVFVGMRFIPLVNKTISAFTMMASSEGHANSIIKLHDELTPETQQKVFLDDIPSLPFEKTLALQDISFAFQSKNKESQKKPPVVLKNIDITIKKGQHIGLVGPSGAGKSTIIDIMLGLLTNYEGQYKVDDTVISDNNIFSLRKIMSFVDQSPFLLNDSYIANIAYGEDPDDIDPQYIQNCLQTVGLWEHVSASHKQLQTNIGENGKDLSGGQRQRLAIARALYRNAQILILDEASSALDMDSEANLIELLNQLKGRITVISIAHRLSTLKNCDKVIFVEKGKILAEGNFAELYKKEPIFKRYVQQSNIEVEDE